MAFEISDLTPVGLYFDENLGGLWIHTIIFPTAFASAVGLWHHDLLINAMVF
jgi:hypothetical protein